MKKKTPSRAGRIDRILHEELEDPTADPEQLALALESYAYRIRARATSSRWAEPPRTGRPLEASGLLAEIPEDYTRGALEHLHKIVKTLRTAARKRFRTRSALAAALLQRGDLMGGYQLGSMETFAPRLAEAVMGADAPKLAAARLLLLVYGGDDSLEGGLRLLERFKKQGKNPA